MAWVTAVAQVQSPAQEFLHAIEAAKKKKCEEIQLNTYLSTLLLDNMSCTLGIISKASAKAWTPRRALPFILCLYAARASAIATSTAPAPGTTQPIGGEKKMIDKTCHIEEQRKKQLGIHVLLPCLHLKHILKECKKKRKRKRKRKGVPAVGGQSLQYQESELREFPLWLKGLQTRPGSMRMRV